jgi:hypothetical protein
MEWNGMEWNGMEWNGMEWNDILHCLLSFHHLSCHIMSRHVTSRYEYLISKITLNPCKGQPQETGPESPGWVEVVENNISYGFDITRVMFCSGNCTERIRMGQEVRNIY